MKSKIEWCDMTWNPVRGCMNNCLYCYARRNNKRLWRGIVEKEEKFIYQNYTNGNTKLDNSGFANNLKLFIPEWIESNFQRKFPQKPSRIFVNSMSEIWFWKLEWMERVLEKIKQYPQHTFQFLTKFPGIYETWPHIFMSCPSNIWAGFTITKNEQLFKWGAEIHWYDCYKYVSIEPILEEIDIYWLNFKGRPNDKLFNWIIVGAETGNRKNKVIPEKEWIENIRIYCQENKIPYFEKPGGKKRILEKIVERELVQEFPDESKIE